MSNQNTIKELDQKYIMNTYARNDVVLAAGRGATAYDMDSKAYIDFGSGIGVNSLGYCDQDWCVAVCKQVMMLQHTSNLYYSTPNIELAKQLCERTGYHRVFFSNSGAEANEGAIKIAREYGKEKYGGKRNKILTLVNSFHGRTVTTLAATGQDVFHEKFLPLTTGFDYVIANDVQDLTNKLDKSVVALMIEIVQGEGGVVPLQKEFVQAVQAVCEQNDLLLIVDEVQTGVGRTGTFLASEQFGLKPDITTLAKGLAGGLPIGAVLVNEKCDLLHAGDHGSTFGGNPVSCAGAKVVLDKMDDAMLQGVRDKGAQIRQFLSDCDEVAEITGLGMMIGIKLKTKKAADVKNECLHRGLMVLTAKDKIRLLPPLTISQQELQRGLLVLKRVLED